MVDYKMVNGELVPLSAGEQSQRDSDIANAIAEKLSRPILEQVPDLATQLATALIAKNIISKDDIRADTLSEINSKLIAADIAAIK